MSHLQPADDGPEEPMPSLQLTETPAAMSPPSHAHSAAASLPAHIAGLASDSDEWEDEDEEDDMDGLEQVGSLETRQRWMDDDDEDDEDDEEFGRFGFGAGNTFGSVARNLRQQAMEDFRKSDKLLALNPYKLSLTSVDLESCVALESQAFTSDIAATREKVSLCSCHSRRKRLSHCRAFAASLFNDVVLPGSYHFARFYRPMPLCQVME
jgi:hypothetical protein